MGLAAQKLQCSGLNPRASVAYPSPVEGRKNGDDTSVGIREGTRDVSTSQMSIRDAMRIKNGIRGKT